MQITAVDTIQLAEYPQQLWLQLHTDEGITGLGETCIGPATVAAHVHETVAPHLIGADPRQIDRLSRKLYDLFVGYAGTGAETRGNSAANIALWDISAQAAGIPVHDLLGGRTREAIRIYNTCAGGNYGRGNAGALLASDRASAGDRGLPTGASVDRYEDLDAALHRPGELAQELLEQGITGMKVWPFDEYAAATSGADLSAAQLREGRSRLEKIRHAVGDDMDVMVELHALWNLPAALRIAHAVEDLNPYWIEDAIKADDLGAAATFAGAVRAPVAMGETLAGRWSFRDLIASQSVGVVMFDIGWCGGLSEAKKIATLAESHSLPIALHDCTGPVVLTAATHLAVNAPNALVQETVRAYHLGWYRDVVTEIPCIDHGFIAPPAGPGLGTALQPGITGRSGAIVRTTTARDL